MKEKLLKLGYYFIPFYSFVNLGNLILSFIYTDNNSIEINSFFIFKILLFIVFTIVSLYYVNKKKWKVLPLTIMIAILIIIQVFGVEISNLFL